MSVRQRTIALIRRMKYTIASDVIQFLISNSPVLDGDGKPPAMINFAGSNDFTETGDRNTMRLAKRAFLKDGHAVLEIGSGIGRNALSLTNHFPSLSYFGFDIVKYGITWCQKHFRNSKNIWFSHSDIYNK